MSKRVQVPLSDEDFEILERLAELRGESMAAIIADAIKELPKFWRFEVRERANAEAQQLRVEEALNRKLERKRAARRQSK